MSKIYNFSAGPGMLPEEVMQTAQAEFRDWHGTGMSIMELGHRGEQFKQVAEQAEADLRELMAIPDNYHVLMLPGGASTQFAMVPLNLFADKPQADYVNTGIWSEKAIAEASRYGAVNIAAHSIEQHNKLTIPTQDQWQLTKDAAYLHYTPNETISGLEFNWIPEVGAVPLVADMSSMILSRPVDVQRYGLIYAGAQKNIGQAGITVVIIREDLAKRYLPHTPTLYQYATQAQNQSFYNTPPTYSWYIAGLTFAWLKRRGGIAPQYAINQRKAQKLYACIDQHTGFYTNNIDNNCRSLMNVVFTLPSEALTQAFISEADKQGLKNLRGHRIVGGIRASIYNAMPEAGVDALTSFMHEFVRQKG